MIHKGPLIVSLPEQLQDTRRTEILKEKQTVPELSGHLRHRKTWYVTAVSRMVEEEIPSFPPQKLNLTAVYEEHYLRELNSAIKTE